MSLIRKRYVYIRVECQRAAQWAGVWWGVVSHDVSVVVIIFTVT